MKRGKSQLEVDQEVLQNKTKELAAWEKRLEERETKLTKQESEVEGKTDLLGRSEDDYTCKSRLFDHLVQLWGTAYI